MPSTFQKVMQVISRPFVEYAYDIPQQENIYPVLAGETTVDKKTKYANEGGMQAFLERVAIQSSWVYSDIDFISKYASLSQFKVVELGQSELPDREDVTKPKAIHATTHPLDKLLNNPNPWMSGSFLRMYSFMWMLLRGEVYWMFVPNELGELVEIWPIPSDRIRPIASEKDYIEAFEYTSKENGVPIPLSAEYIVFFRTPNIFDYHRGLSKLTALKTALDVDNKAQSWNIDTFNNELNLRTIISLPPTISQRNYAVIKQELIDELVNRKKRYVIARGGELNAQTIGMAHKDIEYLAGRKFTREEIDRVMGLPTGFWSEDATESSMNVAKEIVTEITIWPLLSMMAEDLTVQILHKWWPNDKKGTFVVKADDPRPKNKLLELEEERRDFETMTIDEVRAFTGRTPYQNGYGALPWVMRQTEQAVKLFLPDGMTDTKVNEEGVLETTTSVGNYAFEAPIEDPNENPATIDMTREGNPVGGLTPSGSIAGTQSPIRSKKADTPSSEPVEEIAKETKEQEERALKSAKAIAIAKDTEYKKWLKVAEKSDERAMSFATEFIDEQEEFDIKSAFLFAEPLEVLHHYEEMKAVIETVTYTDNPQAQNIIVALIMFLTEMMQQYKDGVITQEAFYQATRMEFNIAVSRLFELGSDTPYISWNPDMQNLVIKELMAIYDSLGKIIRRIDVVKEKEKEDNTIYPLTFGWISGIIALHLGGIYYLAMTKGRPEKLLTWRLGNTIEHCSTCSGFNGQSKTAEEWEALGTYPRAKNGTLECGGWNCDCRFEEVG